MVDASHSELPYGELEAARGETSSCQLVQLRQLGEQQLRDEVRKPRQHRHHIHWQRAQDEELVASELCQHLNQKQCQYCFQEYNSKEHQCHKYKDRSQYEFGDSDNGGSATPMYRARAQSMHSNVASVERRERFSRRNARRKSLPSVGDRIYIPPTDRALIENFLSVPTMDAGNDDDRSDDSANQNSDNEPASVRRARSFRERKNRPGEPLRRVRSFKTTSKGLVNRGDSFKSKKNTSAYSGSAVNCSDDTSRDVSVSNGRAAEVMQQLDVPTLEPVTIQDQSHYFFRVMMIGGPGVGKSSLIDQFMTSDFLGSGDFNISQSEDERSVTLQVDGDESTLEFVKSNDMQQDVSECSSIDGYIVVFSLCDRTSFEKAIRFLVRLREEMGSHRAIILAANKSDIVRKRLISTEEGREVADKYGCKYIETSAALNHKVDELLVGMLKQILLKMQAVTSSTEVPDNTLGKSLKRRKNSSFKRTKLFLEKLFRGSSGKEKATENLYV